MGHTVFQDLSIIILTNLITGKPPNITLRIMTRIEEPFVMLKKQKDPDVVLTGNDRFEGFCVDLLEQISDQVGFKYILELVPDDNYGALNLTSGKWNGLVKGNIRKRMRNQIQSIEDETKAWDFSFQEPQLKGNAIPHKS